MRKLLALDIGNAEIKCGVFDGGTLISCCRMASEPKWTGDQYAAQIRALLETRGQEPGFSGAALSSVVPGLTARLEEAAARLCGPKAKPPLTVGPGVRTGLDIRVDNPLAMGSDFVCGAVGALSMFEPPLVIFDFGTATTLAAVRGDGALIGRLIMAGLQASLEALAEKAACLPAVRLPGQGKAPRSILGRSTAEAMEKGALFGHAAMADGLYARCREELGGEPVCVFTGGCARAVLSHCRVEARLRPNLPLYGLLEIWRRNNPDDRA